MNEEIPGLGNRMPDQEGNTWSLGKCGWLGSSVENMLAGNPGCELRKNGRLVRHFTFQESLRPEVAETLAQLRMYQTHILSGDHQDRVRLIAQTLDIDPNHVHSGLSPQDKAGLVHDLDPENSLFLGDGANDSLAFDAASMCGAVAGRGLLESKADFYF